MIKKRVKHHLETSPAETFRVVEEEGEVEEQQDIAEEPQAIAEEPPIPRIGEGERTAIMMNIKNRMIHRQLVPARVRKLRKRSLGGIRTSVTIVIPRKNLRRRNPLGTTQRTLKRRKGQEVQVPEERDIVGGKEV